MPNHEVNKRKITNIIEIENMIRKRTIVIEICHRNTNEVTNVMKIQWNEQMS